MKLLLCITSILTYAFAKDTSSIEYKISSNQCESLNTFESKRFCRSINNNSTETELAVVKVIDENTNNESEYCVPVPFLLGAIHLEYKLKYDKLGTSKGLEYAAKMWMTKFKFKSKNALRNIKKAYSDSELAVSKMLTDKYSNAEIVAAFEFDASPSEIASASNSSESMKMAIAHSIIIRGLNVRIGCTTSSLSVNEDKN